MKLAITASLLCIAPTGLSAVAAQPWALGKEQEVDEGMYMTLVSISKGWRLWKLETSSGIECRAFKSAVGKPHPVPAGAGALFFGGEPFYMIMKFQGKFLKSWKGVDFNSSRVSVRRVGERFWADDTDEKMDFAEGDRIEVTVASWEYPAVRVGYHEAKGVVDFTGIEDMKAAITACNAK